MVTQVRKKDRDNRRKKMFHEQQGRCVYCDGQMLLSFADWTGTTPPENLATFEHLDDRFSDIRGKRPTGVNTVVLACRKCHDDRGSDRELREKVLSDNSRARTALSGVISEALTEG